MNKKVDLLKILAIVGPVLGLASTLMSNWVSNKEQEQMVDEKIQAALTAKNEEES